MKRKIIFGLVMSLMILSSGSCAGKKSSAKASAGSTKMDALNGKEGVFAVMETEKGKMVLELFYKDTPLTVINFVGLAEGTLDAAKGKPFYDGLKFHRVISDFMIQGGDPKGNGTGGPGYKFPDEWCDKYSFDGPGYLAMANSGPNTNGSQFFITHVPTDWLNGKHTIFGKIITGQDVVDSVAQGDTIISLKIIRQGSDAEKFTATQKDFDQAVYNVAKRAEEAKEKAMAEVIKGCEKTPEGIYFQVLKKGNGKKVGQGKKVTVGYKGYLTDGQIFDASKEFHPQGHEPLDFKTAGGEMIPGFDIMVQEMEYGETRKIVLPPEMAYGAQGIPGVIPGGAYICFDVVVLK
ncbi:MAG: peptidylprolyl isomerase [Treponema sp.]|nr:peptidylprolyl isomerase [Treponema sp.]